MHGPRFHDSAKADIACIYGWYEAHQAGLGERFLANVDAVVEVLKRFPTAYRAIRHGRRATLKSFPYSVLYIIDGDSVVVLAVIHSHRNPKEWLKRISRTS
jgi:toxin ParE1/3/4